MFSAYPTQGGKSRCLLIFQECFGEENKNKNKKKSALVEDQK
jgi:hypothetical protein